MPGASIDQETIFCVAKDDGVRYSRWIEARTLVA